MQKCGRQDARRGVMPGFLIVGAGLWIGTGAALASDADTTRDEIGAPIRDALTAAAEDVRTYDMHITTLASPYMQGRVPGSPGMERAKDYIEHYFKEAGLQPAFPDAEGQAFATFRDPFSLGGTWEVRSESLTARGKRGEMEFAPESDFMFTGLGAAGDAVGEAVFIGYSITNGPDDWSSFDPDEDFSGKIAVMFRFEPMDEDGKSLWSDGDGWSRRAGFNRKIRNAAERGAEGVIIINPPGADDPRADSIERFRSGGGAAEVPVVMMAPEAAERLLGASGNQRSIMEWRRMADEGGGAMATNVEVTIAGDAGRTDLIGENIGGYLPGVGELADEWIVIGAHLDHLGMGYFGSRTGPGKLHPGADDNASGSAGLILLADKLGKSLADDDTPRRSLLFIAFDGEESGLNGSRHYVDDPITDVKNHVLMINWDMIGRIENERLTVSGGSTGEGLQEFIEPFFEPSGLEIVVPEQMSGASDHTPFYRSGVPVLFSIIADFHADFHTPNDVVWKINRVGAVKTVRMYHDIIKAASMRADRFPLVESAGPSGRGSGGARPRIRVRLGVQPEYNEEGMGILIGGVTEGGPAANAGLMAGDRLVRWDGQKIEDMQAWMGMLGKHSPGDEVKVGVMRDGAEETLTVTLGGR